MPDSDDSMEDADLDRCIDDAPSVVQLAPATPAAAPTPRRRRQKPKCKAEKSAGAAGAAVVKTVIKRNCKASRKSKKGDRNTI